MSNSIIVPLHDFTEQYETGAFSDCRVKCEDRVWNLHRLVLCARSRFFKAALGGDFGESKTNEVTLEEQDPEVIGQALRYIYSCSMSHIDALVTDDPNGMKLVAYKTYVPLYVLGDFLGLHALCRDIIDRLHRANRRMAAYLQRLAAKDPDGRVHLEPEFQEDFGDCARLAYSVSLQQTHDETTGPHPSGIRTVFVELFEFTRYRPLDDALGRIASEAPLLLVDVMLTMRDIDGVGHPSRRPLACKDCGVHPITGVKVDPPAPAPRQGTAFGAPSPTLEVEVKEPGMGTNFWATQKLCFECSVYYSREEHLSAWHRPRSERIKEDTEAGR